MSALERLLVRFVCKEGDSSGLFNCYVLITLPEKQVVSEKYEKVEIVSTKCTNSNRSLS